MEIFAIEVTGRDKQGQHHKCSKQHAHKMLTNWHECTENLFFSFYNSGLQSETLGFGVSAVTLEISFA